MESEIGRTPKRHNRTLLSYFSLLLVEQIGPGVAWTKYRTNLTRASNDFGRRTCALSNNARDR